MTHRLAPSYRSAEGELERHFRETHEVMTTRQLRSAFGGAGSLSTYADYIKRWKAESIDRSGALSTLLALRSHLENFSSKTELLLRTLSEELVSCPIDCSMNGDDEQSHSGLEEEEISIGQRLRKYWASDEMLTEPRGYRMASLLHEAARTSKARFLDQNADEKAHDAQPDHDRQHLAADRSHAAEPDDNPFLSRADTSSLQAALPLGKNPSGTDERKTANDEGAN